MAEYPAEIYLGNSFNVRAGTPDAPLMVEHPTTGAVGPFTGQTIRVFLATDVLGVPNASPIHAALDIAAMTEDGAIAGCYRAGFAGEDVTAHLAAHVDTMIWVVYVTTGYYRAEQVMVRNPRSGL